MPAENRCAEIEQRLIEALLAHAEPDAETRSHAEGCPTCAPRLRDLASLGARLDRESGEVEPGEALAGSTLARARRMIASPRTPASLPARVPAGLPSGYASECLRLLGLALLPLPLVVAWNLGLLSLGGQLLGDLLPAALLSTLGVAYVAAAAGWSALVYGSIPILAHQRVQRKTAEVRS